MEKLHPQAIIFDLGSTLIEYESIPWDDLGAECAESGRRYLLRRGYDVPGEEEFHEAFADIREAYRRIASESLVEWDVPMVATRLFERLSINHDRKLVDSFFDAYYKPVGEKLYIYEDTLDTLEKLSSSYPVMGLISNTVFPECAHLKELDRFGIGPFLKFTVFSSTFKLRKPHPDIFYHAANLAGYAPSECVYIGDRYVEDIEGPTAVGMEAILKIKADREYPADMPGSVRKIDRLSGLLDHIRV